MTLREQADDTLQRVGLASLMYDDEDPEYRVEDDVTWCTEPLADLPEPELTELKEIIAETIADPTMNREILLHTLLTLGDDETEDD